MISKLSVCTVVSVAGLCWFVGGGGGGRGSEVYTPVTKEGAGMSHRQKIYHLFYLSIHEMEVYQLFCIGGNG